MEKLLHDVLDALDEINGKLMILSRDEIVRNPKLAKSLIDVEVDIVDVRAIIKMHLMKEKEGTP